MENFEIDENGPVDPNNDPWDGESYEDSPINRGAKDNYPPIDQDKTKSEDHC